MQFAHIMAQGTRQPFTRRMWWLTRGSPERSAGRCLPNQLFHLNLSHYSMDLTDLFSNDGDSRLPLPKVNAVQRLSGDESPWSSEQVRGVISNPCYAGVGP